MTLTPIGQAADQLGMNLSTLRYYEERGLVRPAARHAGRRMYGPRELRRLAFVHLIARLGVPLATAGAILDGPTDAWRDTVSRQIAELEELITRARGAQTFLTHALTCQKQHPMSQCPQLVETLDRMLGGTTVEQLAAEHAEQPHQTVPT